MGKNTICIITLLICVANPVFAESRKTPSIGNPFIWCVPVKKIDLNPFRELNDGKELAYWMLLRSYISTDPNEPGLLDAYEFSPDGKVFTGRVSDSAKWSDGARLSPREAAVGIVKGFQFRQMKEKLKALDKSYESIRILDHRTFEIRFESSVENLTGILREALSTGSRHNRVWPVRSNTSKRPEAIAKFPYEYISDSVIFKVGPHRVKLVSGPECKKADFTIYPEVLDLDLSSFDKRQNTHAQAITLQLNTSRLSLPERLALVGGVSTAFSNLPTNSGVQVVPSFFLAGEPGYNNAIRWQNVGDTALLRQRHLKIGVEGPIARRALEPAISPSGLNIEIINLPTDEPLDAQILFSGIKQGRHIILQDILNWAHVSTLIQSAPRTRMSLKKISDRSASTIPPDNRILRDFEYSALIEQSLAPIARKFSFAFSNKDAPLFLDWTPTGELIFRSKNHPKNDYDAP